MPLNENMLKAIALIEETWHLGGIVPEKADLAKELGVSERVVDNYWKDEDFRAQLTDRGIPTGAALGLTAEQIMVINSILNFADKRSQRKKLSDAGVSPKRWQGWMRNPRVRAYLETRSEGILTESVPLAHLALVENVESGDLGSIKLLYEMTGRFKAGSNEVNVPLLLQSILSIIQKNVTDPETLLAISQDFQTLMNGQQLNSSPAGTNFTASPVAAVNRVVKGEIVL